MKFDTLNDISAEKIGDIQSNSVSIDAANLDWIVTILSTNLYSNRIGSFLREAVTNAWDSHVEAGVDDPITILFDKDVEDNYFCKISDYGVGISEERFNKIYRMLGSSTKRDTNSQAGGFGIGRFAALAYTEVVNITSFYDGVMYEYLMYKDGNKLNIDLLNKQSTERRNGVDIQVQIENKTDYHAFLIEVFRQLRYFDNLYIIDNIEKAPVNYSNDTFRYAWVYNNFTIKRYNTFSVDNIGISRETTKSIGAIVGKVLYPLNTYSLTGVTYGPSIEKKIDLLNKVTNLNLNFEIGELSVTPNRESIQYTNKTIEKILERIDEAYDEVIDFLRDNYEDVTCESLDDLLELNGNFVYLPLMEKPETKDEEHSGGHLLTTPSFNANITYIMKFIDNFKIVYKDKVFTDINELYSYTGIIRFLKSEHIKNVNQTLVQNNSLRNSFNSYNKIKLEDILYKKEGSPIRQRVMYCNVGSLKAYEKDYIRHNFSDVLLFNFRVSISKYYKSFTNTIEKLIKDDYARLSTSDVTKFISSYKLMSSIEKKEFRKTIFNWIISNIEYEKYDSKMLPDNYKEEYLKARKQTKGSTKFYNKKFTYYVTRNVDVGYQWDITSDAKSMEFKDLLSFMKNKIVIYKCKDDFSVNFEAVYNITSRSKNKNNPFIFVELSKTRIEWIKDEPNFISIEKFMEKPDFEIIRNFATVKHITDRVPKIRELHTLNNIGQISTEMSSVISKTKAFFSETLSDDNARNLYTKYKSSFVKDLMDVCYAQDIFNQEMMTLFNQYEEKIINAQCLLYFSGNSGIYSVVSSIHEDKINLATDYVLARKLFLVNPEAIEKLKEETIFNNPKKSLQDETI